MTTRIRQQEAERLAEIFIGRLGLAERSFRELISENYPDIFVSYLSLQARKLYERHSPLQFIEQSRYPNSSQIRETLGQLKEKVIHETIFTAEEIKNIATKSFELQINILVSPRVELRRLLYKNTTECTKEDALTVLYGFDERRELISELIQKILDLDSVRLQQEDLESLFLETEEDLLKATPISTLLSEVRAYLRFESSVLGSQKTDFKSELLLEMLSEMKPTKIAEAFSQDTGPKVSWTLAEIESTLGRYLLVGNIEAAYFTKQKRRRPLQGEKRALSMRQFSFFDEEQLFQDDNREGIENLKPEERAPEVEEQKNSVNMSNGRASRRKNVGMENSEADSKLIEQLFNDDIEAYDGFMRKMAQLQDWSQAKSAIEKELMTRNVGMFTEKAMLLGDVVFARFFTGNQTSQ